jgi:transcription elongation factor Elf1
MLYKNRYYGCPNCKRKPHIRFTEDMKDKMIEIECEFCLHKFDVDEKKKPHSQPDTHQINRE